MNPYHANGWIRAIDEELVCVGLGVADPGDDYPQARKKLDSLLLWYCQSTIDPKVNGGFLLMPEETPSQLAKLEKDLQEAREYNTRLQGQCCTLRTRLDQLEKELATAAKMNLILATPEESHPCDKP